MNNDIIKNDPLIPLYIDRLAPDRYAIARNRVVDGVMIPDPDMEIRVDHEKKLAEPLTYQDQNGRKASIRTGIGQPFNLRTSVVTFLTAGSPR